MARFSYTARDGAGQKVTGVEEGPNSGAVASALRAKGLTPIQVEEATARAIFQGGAKPKGGRGKPKLVDVATFIRQLSVMLSAGVGLVGALDDLAVQIQAEKPRFGDIIERVRNRVMSGVPLSAALKEHPKVFGPLVSALIRAGEESGNLEEIMSDLANYLDSQIELRRKVRGAMMYPVFIGVVFVGLVGFMFLFFLPKFKAMFKDESQLPMITKLTLGISDWMQTWWLALVALIVIAWLAAKVAMRTAQGRELLDRVKLKLPVLGNVMLMVILVRFIETLATLQRSGVPILMSLDIAGDTAGNVGIEEAIRRARKEVMRGSFISRELSKSPIFPRMMVRMFAVGEETGRMEELLSRAASYYKGEVDATVEGLTRLIEPAMIVVIGGVVGFVLISIYLPIFKLAGAASGG